MKLTHAQMAVMELRTRGYSPRPFEVETSATGQVYLECIHVVYMIDPDGFYTARRKADGSVLYQEDPFGARASF